MTANSLFDFPAIDKANFCPDCCFSENHTDLFHATLAKLFQHWFPKYPVRGKALGKH
ncbi:hypothetical protein JOB18_033612, partial [Solea senegalensis]